MNSEINEKLEKYFKLTEEALNKVKIKGNLDNNYKKNADDLLDLSKRYFSDAKHFQGKGDLLNAFGAICYAHAFLDTGARIGLFDVDGDNRLFMVD